MEGEADSAGRTRWRRSARSVLLAWTLEWRAAPVGAPLRLVLTVLTGALPAASAWVSRSLLNELAKGADADGHRALLLAVLVAVLGGLSMVVMQAARYTTVLVIQRITEAVERELFARVARFSGLRYFEDPRFHDRLRLAEEAAQQAPQSISAFTQEVVLTVTAIAGYAGILFVVWPPIAGLLVGTAIVALITQIHQAHRYVAVSEAVAGTHRRRYFYRDLLTDPKAAKEIRLFGLAGLAHGRMVAALREATRAELAVERKGTARQSGLGLLGAAVAAIGVVVVVQGAVRGRFTVGDVTLFIAGVTGVEGAFVGIVNQAGIAVRGVRLFGHYVDILDEPDDLPSGSRPVPALSEGIEFRDVWFRYGEESPWVLRGVNLVIPAGRTVGLVGRNGAGKSTFVKLLCRLYDPERGAIHWDGVDLRDLDLGTLRARIRATFQDFVTYDLSAEENIGVGDSDRMADLDRIRHVAGLAEIDATLQGLPDGYRTLLSREYQDEAGQRGTTLSGGQWQRVAVARSLMREDRDLLILDEPSSGLDAEAEYRIERAMREHGGTGTRLLISHRLSALRDADSIVVLGAGAVTEQGTHDELMGVDGEYRRLFSVQARGYQDQRVATEVQR